VDVPVHDARHQEPVDLEELVGGGAAALGPA
jgi:hypothetical protein